VPFSSTIGISILPSRTVKMYWVWNHRNFHHCVSAVKKYTQDVHCSWWHKCTDVFPSPGEQHEFYVMCCVLAACSDSSLLKVLECTVDFERAPYVKAKVYKFRGIILAIHWPLPSTSVFMQHFSIWMAVMTIRVILLKLFQMFVLLIEIAFKHFMGWVQTFKPCCDCHITRYMSLELAVGFFFSDS
jgi:hypothetical protein